MSVCVFVCVRACVGVCVLCACVQGEGTRRRFDFLLKCAAQQQSRTFIWQWFVFPCCFCAPLPEFPLYPTAKHLLHGALLLLISCNTAALHTHAHTHARTPNCGGRPLRANCSRRRHSLLIRQFLVGLRPNICRS